MIEIKPEKTIVRPEERLHITITALISFPLVKDVSNSPATVRIMNGEIISVNDVMIEPDQGSAEIPMGQVNDVLVQAGQSGCIGITAASDSEVAGAMIDIL